MAGTYTYEPRRRVVDSHCWSYESANLNFWRSDGLETTNVHSPVLDLDGVNVRTSAKTNVLITKPASKVPWLQYGKSTTIVDENTVQKSADHSGTQYLSLDVDYQSNWNDAFNRKSKNPSIKTIDKVCGSFRLVYLRIVDPLDADRLKSQLLDPGLSLPSAILAVFPLVNNIWEILVHQKYKQQLLAHARKSRYTVEERYRPAHIAKPLLGGCLDFAKASLRAREQLVARAVIAFVASDERPAVEENGSRFIYDTRARDIYGKLAQIYGCTSIYHAALTALPGSLATCPTGWSCITGTMHYTSFGAPKAL
ncbi:MAG: hypothetical protein Q9209_007166 [Squamulea sp. 1 TL-2023]